MRFVSTVALCLYVITLYGQSRLKVGQSMPDRELQVISPEESVLRFSDLRGKPFILDLWTTWCGNCIAAMPLMHSLQSQFGDSLRILLVNEAEKKLTVERFLQRRQSTKGRITLPVILGDSALTKVALSHQGFPQYCWFDAQGTLRYETSTKQITADNIRSFIRTGKIGMPPTNASRSVWKSELDLGKTGEYTALRVTASGANSISLSGKTMLQLYQFAYGSYVSAARREKGFVRPLPPLREVIESDNDVNRNEQYSYRLSGPDFTPVTKLLAFMRDDLDRYFNCASSVEERVVKYVSITIPDSTVFRDVSGKVIGVVTDAEIHWNNFSVAGFVDNWESNVNWGKPFMNRYPMVDESTYKGRVGNIVVDNIDTSDIGAVERALSPFGVRLRLVEKPLNILVIKDRRERKKEGD